MVRQEVSSARLVTAVAAHERVGALGDERAAAFDEDDRLVLDAAAQLVALVLHLAQAVTPWQVHPPFDTFCSGVME